MLAEMPFLFLHVCGSQPVSDDQIFVTMHEGFALIYRLCLRNKDIIAEDFCTSLNCVAYYQFVSINCGYFTMKYEGVNESHPRSLANAAITALLIKMGYSNNTRNNSRIRHTCVPNIVHVT